MVRASEGVTVTQDQVEELECLVCGNNLGINADNLNQGVDHCGYRYGVSTPTVVTPPYSVMVSKLPDQMPKPISQAKVAPKATTTANK
jgi:hypothetical protein